MFRERKLGATEAFIDRLNDQWLVETDRFDINLEQTDELGMRFNFIEPTNTGVQFIELYPTNTDEGIESYGIYTRVEDGQVVEDEALNDDDICQLVAVLRWARPLLLSDPRVAFEKTYLD